jgi:LacI family transcriptional regulator
MRDVARRAGVAQSSVSRVLSEHPDVSPKMRAAVMAAVEDLGYLPNLLAQGLRSSKTMSVGFTVSDIGNPILAQAVTGAEKRLRNAGYSLLLTNSEGNPELDASMIRLLAQRRVDGMLLSLADESHPATADVLREMTSAVLLDRDSPGGIALSRVIFDHHAGMFAATRHLLELGHREIALIVGGPRRPAHERRRGVLDAAGDVAGANVVVHEADFSVESGRQATVAVLARPTRPTAVIAAGNMLMQGALHALRDAGVRVGEELSFVGCDNASLSELHDPPIAVVSRDMRTLGERGAELLLAQMEGDETIREVVLPTTFLSRPSCQSPPARS